MEKKKITKKEVMDAVKKHQHFLNKDDAGQLRRNTESVS